MFLPRWIYKRLPVIYFSAGFFTGIIATSNALMILPTTMFYMAALMVYEMRMR